MRFIPGIVVSLILCSVSVSGQPAAAPKKKSGSSVATIASYTGGAGDTCLDKKFSVVFYGIDDSTASRTPGLYSAHIDTLITTWNRAFRRICVSFEKCSTIIIPQYEFNRWEFRKTDPGVLKSYYTENVINVYLPEELDNLPASETGSYVYTTYDPGMLVPDPLPTLTGTPNVLVIKAGEQQPAIPPMAIVLPPRYKQDVMHAIGHFFGLPDTFSEVSSTPATPTSTNTAVISTEFADGSNSSVNGDSFSDTEADPYPAAVSGNATPCFFGGHVADGKGALYIAPVDNHMSKWICACRFTQQQYNYMAWFILQKRMKLH